MCTVQCGNTNLPQSPSQEQPLLLEDLLEQEKREQEKQHQQQPQPPPDSASPPLLSDVDFERLRADVLGTPTGGSPPQAVPGKMLCVHPWDRWLTVRNVLHLLLLVYECYHFQLKVCCLAQTSFQLLDQI
jgi:hypothetical protein